MLNEEKKRAWKAPLSHLGTGARRSCWSSPSLAARGEAEDFSDSRGITSPYLEHHLQRLPEEGEPHGARGQRERAAGVAAAHAVQVPELDSGQKEQQGQQEGAQDAGNQGGEAHG